MPGISESYSDAPVPPQRPAQADGPIELTHRKQVAPEASPALKPAASVPAPSPASGHSLLGRVKLVVEQGKILGEQFLLNDYELIIGRYDAGTGRCPDIDLTAQDPAYVHRQHVRLSFSPAGETLTVHDLGGRNGSYVNNKLVERNAGVRVKPGDKIRIGRVVMRLQLAPEVEGDGPAT
jgi:hypothetical protein